MTALNGALCGARIQQKPVRIYRVVLCGGSCGLGEAKANLQVLRGGAGGGTVAGVMPVRLALVASDLREASAVVAGHDSILCVAVL
jgi:hypothetical protein